jgi:LysR family glycine cleavage system transcriptional activator
MRKIHMETPRRLPRLNALRAFEAAGRHASFGAAARELAVTASAVSHQIAELEARLGVRLFRRLNRAVQLTDAGRAALPALSQGFDLLAEGVARARRGDLPGLLTVTTSPGLAAKWLMPRIERFRARHPGIDLRLDASMRLVDFAREDVQVAIRYGAGRYPGLHVELLIRSEAFPVCAPALARGPGALRAPADLARATLIHDESPAGDPSYPDWGMWLRAAGVAGVDAERGPRFTAVNLAVDAALAGRGVLLGRSVFVADDLAAGRLVRPFGAALPLDFSVFLVIPPAQRERPAVAAFRDWVVAEAKAAQTPGAGRAYDPPPPRAPARRKTRTKR